MAIGNPRERVAAATKRFFWMRRVSYVAPDGDIDVLDRERLAAGIGVTPGASGLANDGFVYLVLDNERAGLAISSTTPGVAVDASVAALAITSTATGSVVDANRKGSGIDL